MGWYLNRRRSLGSLTAHNLYGPDMVWNLLGSYIDGVDLSYHRASEMRLVVDAVREDTIPVISRSVVGHLLDAPGPADGLNNVSLSERMVVVVDLKENREGDGATGLESRLLMVTVSREWDREWRSAWV